jgi:hypothetical protein
MATAKKAAAPAAPKKAAPAKKAPAKKPTISVANVPISKAPATKGRGRSQQNWSYTGKKLSETTKSTPQFRGLVEGLEEGREQGKWKTPFTMKDLVDYCVVEGFVSMPNTKNESKQKARIIAVYKPFLISEGYITDVV